jgi:DNA polymerase-3 subunit alpha
VLGITNIDPMEHKLLFERFLNPERVSMPDIDIDFCIDRRGDVIEYVEKRYGKDRVAQIVTFGTLAARAALKGVARVLNIPFAESDRLAKMIPATPGTKLKEAIAKGTPLGQIYETDDKVKHLIDLALELEGTISNNGVHAAGVVISRDPLDEVVPLMYSKEGQLVTQYAMDHVASLGLLKMDFLGLRNLTIIDNTLNLVSKVHDKQIDINHLPLDDDAVYKTLSSGDTDGVFQLESGGMKALVRELKPTTFEDINALVALFRPGPLNSGMVDSFVKRKHGKEKVSYQHPLLESILKDSYGTIVYQEQIMQIAQKLGGYTLGQADLLRRAMGKKKAEEMGKQEEAFVSGAQTNGVSEKVAKDLFESMSEFAAYCFNRSHSAAYAMIAYQTAYLKTHYPVEYLSALLSAVKSDLDKIKLYSLVAQKLGIKVLPPDVQISGADFTPDGQAIRFGLACIKHVGAGVVDKIVEARTNNPNQRFESIEDFCEKVGLKQVNRRTLESLVTAGAFDSFGLPRKYMMQNLDNWYSFSQRLNQAQDNGQASLFALMGSQEQEAMKEKIQWQGAPDEYLDQELQQFEKDLLGTYVTSHPLESVRDILPLTATKMNLELKEQQDGIEVVISGLITSAIQKHTKQGKPIFIGQLEDLTATCEFVAFSEVISQFQDYLKEGQKVAITGKLQFRGDDSHSIVVSQVRPLNDVHILALKLKSLLKYEDIAFLGQTFARIRGLDPVVMDWPDESRMLLGQQFWIDASRFESLKPMLEDRFGSQLEMGWAS